MGGGMTEHDQPLLGNFFRKKRKSRYSGRISLTSIPRVFKRLSFRQALALSMILHGAVVGVLMPGWNPLSLFGHTGVEREEAIFRRAAAELGISGSFQPREGGRASSGSTRDFIRDMLRQFGRIDLSDKNKLALWKHLLDELLSVQGGGESLDPGFRFKPEDLMRIWKNLKNLELDSGDLVIPAPAPDEFALRFFTLPREEIERMRKMRREDERDREGAVLDRGRVRIETGDGVKFIPREYYFRESEYEAVLARGAELFTIVRGFPRLEIESNVSGVDEVNKSEPALWEKTGRSFRVIYVRDVKGGEVRLRPSRADPGAPLDIYSEKGRVREVLDGLMALNEHEQFDFFKEKYLDPYDPEEGDLTRLTRDFIYGNLCNIIIVFNPISGAFGFLEQLFYSGPLDRMYLEYWRAHPGTRTGVEFLHVLAGHYNFEQRALRYLFDAHDEARRTLAQTHYVRDVYRKKLKSYVVAEVHDRLMRRFRAMGFDHRDQVMARYSTEQEKIYRLILSLGDRFHDDALDGLARLSWEAGDRKEAIRLWKKISNSYRDITYRRIRHSLGAPRKPDQIERTIEEILYMRNLRGSEELLERLVRFDRWAKRIPENRIGM